MQGSGTQADPYIISSTDDMLLLNESRYASYVGTDKYFELGADLDFTGITSFIHIGTSTYVFNGHFDGKNHSINNLTFLNGSSYYGCFSHISGDVSNLVFNNCSATVTNGSSGAIFAYQLSNGNVQNIHLYNCSFKSTNSSGSASGFIYRTIGGTLTNCSIYNCVVYGGNQQVGGIIGSCNNMDSDLTIDDCHVINTYIYGISQVGGILGYLYEDTDVYDLNIIDCTVENCVVYSYYGNNGGICGACGVVGETNFSGCSVINSYIYAQLSSRYSSGIVYNIANSHSSSQATITDCTLSLCSVCNYTLSSCHGIIGTVSSVGVIITNPTITNNYIAGVGGVSNSSVYITVVGGTQDCNNITSGNNGLNVSGYTDQINEKSTYITATGVTASYSGGKVTYTISGQRGCSVKYDTLTYAISGGKVWDYKNDGTEVTNYSDVWNPDTNGSFSSKVTLSNNLDTTGVTLQLSTPVVVTAISGTGTEADPYVVLGTLGLSMLSGDGYASYVGNDKYFKLGADVDFEGATFTPIGTFNYKFNGHFDGDNHVVSNMIIGDSSSPTTYQGMFKCATGGYYIHNLTISDSELYCSYGGGMLVSATSYDNDSNISYINIVNCDLEGTGNRICALCHYMGEYATGDYTVTHCNVINTTVTTTDQYGIISGFIGVINLNTSPDITCEISNNSIDKLHVYGDCAFSDGYLNSINCGSSTGCGTLLFDNNAVTNSIIECHNTIGLGSASGIGVLTIDAYYNITITISNCSVSNTYISGRCRGGGLSTACTIGTASVSISNVDINNCTIASDGEYDNACVGGIFANLMNMPEQLSDISVTHNTIMSDNNSGVGGFCGGNSSGTSITPSGTQDYNNIYGYRTRSGVDFSNPTNQTSVANQYITATKLRRTISGNKATFTIEGQRGAGVSYDSTTNRVTGGMVWKYYNTESQEETTNYDLEYTYDSSADSYIPTLHLYNPSNTTGVTLICVTPPQISIAKGSLSRRTLPLTPTYYNAEGLKWYISKNQSSWTEFSTTLGAVNYTFGGSDDGTYYFKCIANCEDLTTTSNIVNEYAMYGGGSGGLTNHDQTFMSRYHI